MIGRSRVVGLLQTWLACSCCRWTAPHSAPHCQGQRSPTCSVRSLTRRVPAVRIVRSPFGRPRFKSLASSSPGSEKDGIAAENVNILKLFPNTFNSKITFCSIVWVRGRFFWQKGQVPDFRSRMQKRRRSLEHLGGKFMTSSLAINCDNANQRELKEMRRRRYRAS